MCGNRIVPIGTQSVQAWVPTQSVGTRKKDMSMMQYKRATFGIAAVLTALFMAPTVHAADWPGWRGPTGAGYTEEKDLPLTWDGKTGENVVWKIALGGVGNSSPIVWKDRVYVTTSAKQAREDEQKKTVPPHHINCYAVADGKQLWSTDVPPGEHYEGYDIFAVPTPVTDGERVYAWFGSGVVAAVDMDGKLVWRKERAGPFNLNPGLCSSPILYQDAVVLLCDQGRGQGFLQGLDKKTGEVKWEQKRPTVSHNNTTPVLIQVGDKTEMIVAASNAVQGLDPSDGKVLWTCAANGLAGLPRRPALRGQRRRRAGPGRRSGRSGRRQQDAREMEARQGSGRLRVARHQRRLRLPHAQARHAPLLEAVHGRRGFRRAP